MTPGAYYSADAWAMNTARDDTLLLRISWYGSDDASGSAIDSADSQATVTGDAGGFRLLSTGPLQAPANAHSARVRLLLEPASAAPTRAFFDDVSFGETAAPADSSDPNGSARPTTTSRHAGSQLSGGESSDPPAPEVLAGEATPIRIANVRPAPRDLAQKGAAVAASLPWLALAILVPGVALGSFGAEEVVRARRQRKQPASEG